MVFISVKLVGKKVIYKYINQLEVGSGGKGNWKGSFMRIYGVDGEAINSYNMLVLARMAKN